MLTYTQVNQIDFMDAVDCGIRSNLKKGMKALGMCFRIYNSSHDTIQIPHNTLICDMIQIPHVFCATTCSAVNFIRTPHVYFAERLWETIKGGISLDDKSLMRILITRSEVSMHQIVVPNCSGTGAKNGCVCMHVSMCACCGLVGGLRLYPTAHAQLSH